MNHLHKHLLLSLLLTASSSLSLTAMDAGVPGAGAGMAASGSSADDTAKKKAAHIANLLTQNPINYWQRTQGATETERNAVHNALLQEGLEALEAFTLNPSSNDLRQKIEAIATLLKNHGLSAHRSQLLAAVVQKKLILLISGKTIQNLTDYVTLQKTPLPIKEQCVLQLLTYIEGAEDFNSVLREQAQALADIVNNIKDEPGLFQHTHLSDKYVTALLPYWKSDKLLDPDLFYKVTPFNETLMQEQLGIIKTASANTDLTQVGKRLFMQASINRFLQLQNTTLLNDYLEGFRISTSEDDRGSYIESLVTILNQRCTQELNAELSSMLVHFTNEQLCLARFDKSYPQLLKLASCLSSYSPGTANLLCATLLKTLTTKNCSIDILTSHGLTHLEPIMFIRLSSILNHISNRTLLDTTLTLINARATAINYSALIMLGATQTIVQTPLLTAEEKATMIPNAIFRALHVDTLGNEYVTTEWTSLGYMLHTLPLDTLYAIIHNLLERIPLITTPGQNPRVTAEIKTDRLCQLISRSLMKKNDHRTYQRADITFTAEQADILSCMAYDLLLWNTEERTTDPHTADLIPFLYHLTMRFTSQENVERMVSLFLHHLNKKTLSYEGMITRESVSPDDLPLLQGYVHTDRLTLQTVIQYLASKKESVEGEYAKKNATKLYDFFNKLWWNNIERVKWLLACNADNIAEVRASRPSTETILEESDSDDE